MILLMILKIENLHNDFNKTMFAIYNFPLKKLIVNAVFFLPVHGRSHVSFKKNNVKLKLWRLVSNRTNRYRGIKRLVLQYAC